MKVTFIKTDPKGYSVSIVRSKGSPLTRRQAPGYDGHLPPDLAQFVIEEEFGIRFGAFGQLAAYGESVSQATARDRSGRKLRASHRTAEIGRTDMARSESLVGLCRTLWEARAGRIPARPAVIDMKLATPFDVDRVIHRLDEVSSRWVELVPGESITVEWPTEPIHRAAGLSAGQNTR